MSTQSFPIRRYINTNNDPMYISTTEYKAQLHSKEKPAKFIAYEEPELINPVMKWSKKRLVTMIDILVTLKIR